MVKQGGWSWNSGSNKKGMQGRFKCKFCDRMYKQEWSKNTHEKKCKEYHKARGESQ